MDDSHSVKWFGHCSALFSQKNWLLHCLRNAICPTSSKLIAQKCDSSPTLLSQLPHLPQKGSLILPQTSYSMPNEQETKYSVRSPEQCMHQHSHPCTDWAASFKQREIPGLLCFSFPLKNLYLGTVSSIPFLIFHENGSKLISWDFSHLSHMVEIG